MRKHQMITFIGKTAVFAVVFAFAAIVCVPAGATEKTLTKAELRNLISKSETKADHERVARYFDTEAVRYEAEAKDHEEMGRLYQKSPDPALSKHPGTPRAAGHCDSLSKTLRNASEDARQLAAEHREMAKEARK